MSDTQPTVTAYANPFDGCEVLDAYTADDAVEDGILEDLPDPPDPDGCGLATFDRPAVLPLGRIVATPDVIEHLGMDDLAILLNRHARGDWGDVDPDDARANDDDLRHGGRILSAYNVRGERVWVLTEADRSLTTCCYPREY